MNIVVTTPKNQMALAAAEAQDCIDGGGGFYFRRFPEHSRPQLGPADRVFYVEDGYVRGFGVVTSVKWKGGEVCGTSGRLYSSGFYAYMEASSWKWIKPIPMKGFQGWRYFDQAVEVVGGWLDPRPTRVTSEHLQSTLCFKV